MLTGGSAESGRGPFLERPGNSSGPELYFKIKIRRMVVYLFARKPA